MPHRNKPGPCEPRALDIAGALDLATRRLAAAGVPEARRDARLLIAHAMDVRPEVVFGHPKRMLEDDEAAALDELVAARAERRPMAQIVGEREFWSLPFKVTADTLDPRPESETVVQAALDDLPDHYARLRVLDLGTGTGCLLLALLSELPRAFGIGIDISAAALKVARRNAAALILAHNHPSGVAQPSQADELLTRSLREALALVDIKVLDHFIVAGNQTLSFAERGLL